MPSAWWSRSASRAASRPVAGAGRLPVAVRHWRGRAVLVPSCIPVGMQSSRCTHIPRERRRREIIEQALLFGTLLGVVTLEIALAQFLDNFQIDAPGDQLLAGFACAALGVEEPAA